MCFHPGNLKPMQLISPIKTLLATPCPPGKAQRRIH